ncbi:tetratricopeptide repeat protein [Candidatus Eisenbacteria bacterium]|uniref:Tetratricopeptide repeat protein n=1 Tax=Eiseniibacteriota bacterium TaxID=2212470 RepID=A0ABV6YIA2_UNCEI
MPARFAHPRTKILLSTLPMLLFLLWPPVQADRPAIWGNLAPGSHPVGFKVFASVDASRTMPLVTGTDGPAEYGPRTVRIYVWYPATAGTGSVLRVGDYAHMAAEDFALISRDAIIEVRGLPLPVPLAKGVEIERQQEILESVGFAMRDAQPDPIRRPLLLVGQGLYYESPLTQFILCEYMASHGYVVATCPLVGTHTRLVNLNVVDLETEVRDLEFILAQARKLEYVDQDELGVIGYDLGGMAGLLLTMRNPDVDAFLSLDAGILSLHFSGLPNNHPSYAADKFRAPWMHMTQARFVPADRTDDASATLFDRKQYADSYLLLFNTISHGSFTSYANFGITAAVPGYWGPISDDGRRISLAIGSYARDFFDAYLKGDRKARDRLSKAPSEFGLDDVITRLERRPTSDTPAPHRDELVQVMIERGMDAAAPVIASARASYPDSLLFDEGVLNWLGYHFLYWWGRKEDAVGVFELNADIHSESGNAYDSLGEAYAALGNHEKALDSYRRSLELNPANANAAQMIERLEASAGPSE